MAMATPSAGALAAMTPEQLQAYRWEKEIDERNRPYTDEELELCNKSCPKHHHQYRVE